MSPRPSVLQAGPYTVPSAIGTGRLVRDERFARLLERCPDPLEGGEPGSVRAEPSPEEIKRERADLELDAMQLLSRTQRWTTIQRDRNRDRIDELRDESKRRARQRDKARERVQRLRKRIDSKNKRLASEERKAQRRRGKVQRLRQELRAERRRPWNRLRRTLGRLARR